MKLKAIHCYQYVRFQNKNENFLTAKVGMEDLELELLPEGVVSVKTAADHILIFPTNIAYCVPFNEQNKAKKIETRGSLLENDPSSPKKK